MAEETRRKRAAVKTGRVVKPSESKGESSVIRALQLLQVFKPMEKTLGLSEIARRAGMPKSTAHRLLNIMAEARFIRAAEDGSYALGLQLWELGLRVVSNLDLREIAHPVIEWLHHLAGDAVHIAILDDCDVVYIDRLEIDRHDPGLPPRRPPHAGERHREWQGDPGFF